MTERHDTYWKDMEEDPDFRLCRREATLGAIVGLVFIAYVATVVGLMGFGRSPDEYRLILGFPDWLVIGQFLPTVVLIGVVILFGKKIMKPLAEERTWIEARRAPDTTSASGYDASGGVTAEQS